MDGTNEKLAKDYAEIAGEVVIFIIGMILLVGGNMVIFGRVFSISVPWTEEILRNCFVWLIFIGTAFESKRGLVSITILEDILKNKNNQIYYKTTKIYHAVAAAIFAGFCSFNYFQLMLTQFRMQEKSIILGYLTGYVTLGVFLGCLLWTVYQIIIIVKDIRNLS